MIGPLHSQPLFASKRTPLWSLLVIGLVIGSSFLLAPWLTNVLALNLGQEAGPLWLVGIILLRPDVVRAALTGRSAKYSPNSMMTVLAFISLLGLLNILSWHYDFQYDLTETQEFSLSTQTVEILETMQEPVRVIGFFRMGDQRLRLARDFLERYSRHTPWLSYEFHDPHAEPELAKTYQIKSYGLIFISGDNRYEVPHISEQAITTGLVHVTSSQLDEELHRIEDNPPPDRRLFLTSWQTGLTLVLTLIAMPLTIFIIGISFWWKRR